jgi:hypothetical protein
LFKTPNIKWGERPVMLRLFLVPSLDNEELRKASRKCGRLLEDLQDEGVCAR